MFPILTSMPLAILGCSVPLSGMLIIFIILFLALRNLGKARALSSVIAWERRQIGELHDAVAIQRAEAQEDEAAEPVQLESLRDVVQERSVAFRSLERILLVRDGGGVLGVQEVLALGKEEVHREVEGRGFRQAAHVAMVLGILGTFLGLASMVQTVGVPDSPAHATELAGEVASGQLAAVVSSMKTAFSTSLAGLAVSLMLLVVASNVEKKRDSLCSAIEGLLLRDLSPLVVNPLNDENHLRVAARRLDKAYERLDEATERNAVFLDRLSGIHDSYLQLLDRIRELGRSEEAQDFDEVVESLASANRAVLQVAEALPRAVAAIEAGQSKLIDRLTPGSLLAAALGGLGGRSHFKLPAAVAIAVLATVTAILLIVLLRG